MVYILHSNFAYRAASCSFLEERGNQTQVHGLSTQISQLTLSHFGIFTLKTRVRSEKGSPRTKTTALRSQFDPETTLVPLKCKHELASLEFFASLPPLCHTKFSRRSVVEKPRFQVVQLWSPWVCHSNFLLSHRLITGSSAVKSSTY